MKTDSFKITSSNLFFAEYISDLCQLPVSFHCLDVCLIFSGKDTKVLIYFSFSLQILYALLKQLSFYFYGLMLAVKRGLFFLVS